MIRLTATRRGSDNAEPVYVNPRYIKRISLSTTGETVVEVEGSDYGTWCKETPTEVFDLIVELDNG